MWKWKIQIRPTDFLVVTFETEDRMAAGAFIVNHVPHMPWNDIDRVLSSVAYGGNGVLVEREMR